MDYSPSVYVHLWFVFVTFPQKKILFEQALRHKHVNEMKRRRVERQSRSDGVPIAEVMPNVLAATLTTGQVSDEMSEISLDLAESQALLKKELVDERQYKDWRKKRV